MAETYTGWGRTGATSVLASFCISAWREAALRLPPDSNCQRRLFQQWQNKTYRQLHLESLVGCTSRYPSREQCWLVAGHGESIARARWWREQLTVRPASSKPSICSKAILASSARLYLREGKWATKNKLQRSHVLHKSVSFAPSSHGIPVKVDEF